MSGLGQNSNLDPTKERSRESRIERRMSVLARPSMVSMSSPTRSEVDMRVQTKRTPHKESYPQFMKRMQKCRVKKVVVLEPAPEG